MMGILVSVIIPVYNVELFLPKCLDSLLHQTFSHFEVVLIDDGSTDTSGSICDRYAKFDSRFKALHKTNGGVSSARNLGIEMAIGDYICFVDADDWIEYDYLELATKYLLEHKPIRLLNNYLKDDGKGNIVNKYQGNSILVMDNDTVLYEMIKGNNFGWAPFASFYEAKALKKIRFDETIRFGEDLLFNYCFIKENKGKFLYVPIAKYHYMFRESSACNSYSINKKMDDIKVIEYIMNLEDNAVGEILYCKEYIPRLVQRIKIAAYSKNEDDMLLGNTLKQCLKRYCWKTIKNNNISSIMRIKVLITLLPYPMIRMVDKVFQAMKG